MMPTGSGNPSRAVLDSSDMSLPPPPPQSLPPPAVMVRLVTGFWITQALYVAAKLGIADLLAEGPRTPADLAQAAGADARSLYRLLRALASEGVFTEDAAGCFGLTPLAECLRTGVPGSVRAWILVMG